MDTFHSPIAAEQHALYSLIRNAESWSSLIGLLVEREYQLFPAKDDIYAVNFNTRRVIYLSDSGHFFPFLIERLGYPPEGFVPENFIRRKTQPNVPSGFTPKAVILASLEVSL
jgi:hypothetical protein